MQPSIRHMEIVGKNDNVFGVLQKPHLCRRDDFDEIMKMGVVVVRQKNPVVTVPRIISKPGVEGGEIGEFIGEIAVQAPEQFRPDR